MSAMAWFKIHKGLVLVSILCGALLISTIVLASELSRAWAAADANANNPDNTTEPPGTQPWEVNYRVPADIQVHSYDIFLQPFLQNGTFFGTVSVTLEMAVPRAWLAFHIKDLTVTHQEVYDTGTRQNYSVIDAFPYQKNEFFVMTFSEDLPNTKITAYMEFKGDMTESIVGFYRSVYTESGKSTYIATSKFEPVDARQAFPCFDEPALKATFTVSLVAPSTGGYTALSNMDVIGTVPGPGPDETTYKFAISAKMSTYLACFIISNFETLGKVTARNIPITVYSTPGQTKNTVFARDAAKEVVEYYSDYFGIPYPLPKLDLVAIPDFVSGAMENWGLITFRETALLYDDQVNSAANQKRVAMVVAHEVSHQWFGNLVTMAWWDDLWLNEGFASFMEYKGVQQMKAAADWNIVDQGVYDDVQSVMTADSELSSHPIVQPVDHPNQITELFDSISYDKGQAVLRMLENFMGEDKFKEGLQNYLKENQFGNAATQDLWTHLTQVAGTVNVSSVMGTWTRQAGYPVISAVLQDGQLVLTQKRFLRDPDATFNVTDSPFGYTWDIPVQYWTSEDTSSQLVWLARDQASVSIPWPVAGNPFVKINSKQVGFYRVSYPEAQWTAFRNLLLVDPSTKMPDLDRANLVDDLFNLADAGLASYHTALDFVSYLKGEEAYLPWASSSTVLKRLASRLSSTNQANKIKQYVQTLVGPKYGSGTNQYNWDVPAGDPHLRRMTRVKLLDLACQSGLTQCTTEAGNKFKAWIADATTPIHPDLRPLVYRYGMMAVGTEPEWQAVWLRYVAETNAQEKMNLLESLAYAKDPALLTNLLEKARDDSLVRAQDYFLLLNFVSNNPAAKELLWTWYKDNWQYLVDRFTLYHRSLGTSILTVTGDFATQAKLDELQAFYAKYPDAGAGVAARKRALEKVQNNIKWLARNEAVIADWTPPASPAGK